MSVRKSRRSLVRDPGALQPLQASALRSQRRLSRGVLLTGTSVLALILTAPDGALARPFGSTTTISAPTFASDAATATAQQAAAVATQSQNALARATKAIQALQAAQAAARSAAQAAGASQALPQVVVPNGLAPGGLQVAPGATAGSPLWQGAALPTQSANGGQTSVTINQTAPQAILNWQTFNVGSQTTVNFNQQASTWTALNRVIGNLGPSQILGRINAPGQVLVINQNGIIFGGASQINVGSLIASTAGIADAQFLATGIYAPRGGLLPSFTGAGGKIVVESGALITTNAPASATVGGGFVLLMGTEVDNAGSITTPKGQTQLAAGDAFFLRQGFGTDTNQYSTTHGNEIAPVLAGGSTSGTVSNTGLILSQQGDITLAGHTIVQDGILLSTTSVNQRGTIHLLNSASDATGSVTLTGNSLSLILPELNSTATALNSQRDGLIAASGPNALATGVFDNLSTLPDRQDQSRVEIVTGGLVDFKSGSLTMAQGGQVAVSAGQRVFAESGATIDVSGTNGTVLPASANDVLVNIQGNELRDSPQNRDSGTLLNANVWIDARNLTLVPAGTGGYATDRYYTAGGLLEVSGYLNNSGRTIGEWTAVGGTITLAAPQVVAQQGSTFNISGGSVQYQGGYVSQTYLLGSDGRIYNINSAPSDLTYLAVANGFVVTHSQGGKIDSKLTQVYLSPFGHQSVQWQDGYTVGRDAGSLILSTPTAIFEGSILAAVIDGERQISARPSGVTDGYKLTQNTAPLAGTLSLGQYGPAGLSGAYTTDVIFGEVAPVAAGMGVSDALPSNRLGTAWFDAPALNSSGLGGLKVATGDSITVEAPLTFAPGAQVSLVAPNVTIAADITAHAGNVIVSNILTSATGTSAFTNADGGAQLTLAAGRTIDASGVWVNGITNPDSLANLAFLGGGNVTFDSTQNVTLAAGSTIDVSSGGAILPTGKTLGGKGGSVTIKAGDVQQNAGRVGDGTLVLDGMIRAYGVAGGGTLTISSPGNILIGDNASLAGGVLAAGTPAPVPLKLTQALTIPAGQPLPTALTLTVTSMIFDRPTPTTITLSGTLPSAPTGADWPLPTGLTVWSKDGNCYGAWPCGSNILPAGSLIQSWAGSGKIPAGTTVHSNVFPDGLPVDPYQVTYAAGSVQATPMTYQPGVVIPAGTVLPQTVAVAPAPSLKPSFFSAGFSNYDINAGQGVLVANGTVLAPTMPVYQFTAASSAAPSGSDPASALSVWLPPLFIANASNATLTQRGGASLTLRSLTKGGNGIIAGAIVVGDNASITVDPGQSIKLDAFGQITVDGNLSARGGSITLVNEADGSSLDTGRNFDAAGNGRGVSVWVGANARLDVSGLADGAIDLAGHAYGQATDGGAISINGGGAFVIIRPGAELDADGTRLTIDLAAGRATAASRPLAVATNGGAITLSSQSGLYLDGDIHAASGGVGAAGGSLSIALITPTFVSQSFPFDLSTSSYIIPANAVVPSVMTVVQGRQPSQLPSDIAPGTNAASLIFGKTTVSAEMITTGGFDSLTLSSGDYMQFSGSVSLVLGQSVTLTAAAFTSGSAVKGLPDPASPPATGSVLVSAPYILFREPVSIVPDGRTSGTIYNPGGATSPTVATFEAAAKQIDIQGLVQFSARAPNGMFAPGFVWTTLVSHGGDIRFLATAAAQGTTLASDWSIDLEAAQIYPATNVVATVMAGQNNSAAARGAPDQVPKLTIGRTTDTIPDAPLSVFGSLTLSAPIVEQGGIVRAPFGSIVLGSGHTASNDMLSETVDVRPGSLTSVSMDDLVIPYGGTVDGVTYTYNGFGASAKSLTNFTTNGVQIGVTLAAQSIDVQSGAILDMSGGGTLSGAGFISGRGGSVDILKTALVNANPATPLSKASDKVYAIVPGYASGYAPVAPENGAGDPAIGQQVTIPAGVPGLPAGTYTLLPSNYALLPGAFRVELGKTATTPSGGAVAIGNGTYVTSGAIGVANTGVESALPSVVLITAGAAVRRYSQYNEQSYSDFMIANAALFGAVRPLLPMDGKTLILNFETPSAPATGSALTFDGTALFAAAQGGFGGQVAALGVGEIYADLPTPGFTGASVRAADLNAVGAPRMMINGFDSILNGLVTFQGRGNDLFVRDGVTLKAGELFLMGGNITIGNDVALTTIGQGAAPFDSTSLGMGYTTSYGTTVLALSNGNLQFQGSNGGSGSINIGAGAQFYSEGTLAFATSGQSTIDPTAHFGSRNITLAVGSINIGDSAAIAAAGAPVGLLFNQALFNTLVNGDPTRAAPALERITLSAANAINVFGTTGLDASGTGVDLVLTTPAIYGYGTVSDHATIAAGKITWNGIAGATPPSIGAGGPGIGAGALDLVANEIDLGRFVSLDTTTSSRVIYGFGNVNLNAGSQIVSAGNSSLYVYQAPSIVAGAVFGQSGTGGNLTLSTPLLTGMQKSIMAYTAGGALNVTSPTQPSAATSTVSGAEIDLTGGTVAIASTILLPSGKLVVNATNDITLGAGSRIDLSGQRSMIQTATVYGFGGTAIFNSAQGGVTQAAGAVIDVSATDANAGSITVSAGNGLVALNGAVNGSATRGYTSGDFSVIAGTLSDFAGLNAGLTRGGFFDARSFDIKAGDLVIGDGVKAHSVTVSVDGGSLTVEGTIDASGAAPGTIRLAGMNGLTLASTAVLDVHGNVLQVDSYGQPIEAKNRGHIELTAAGGTLILSPGATINLSTPNGVAYGDVQLNAQRTGETSGDIAIDASGPLNIRGAYSIALNAFWTYNLPGGSVITQATLDGYDVASTSFINAALGNAGLASRVAGLSAYGSAYHLRPGVQITSSGDLSTSGDIDLAGYRYGANANRDPNSATYGAGEPMALVIRAGGNVTVKGSISDGFKSSAGVPATVSIIDITNNPAFQSNSFGGYTFWKDNSTDVMVMKDWIIPNDAFYNWWTFDYWGNLVDSNNHSYNPGDTIPAGTIISASNSYGFAFEPSNMPVVGLVTSPAIPGAAATTPAASMLAHGSLSASIRLVSGADVAAADQRALQTTQALNGRGNLTLNDPAYNSSLNGTFFSVLRTGTGSLDLLAGGSFSEATPYGVYTAGTQSAPVLSSDGNNPYDLIGTTSGGSGHAWYPEHGGDVLLMAQQDVTGNVQISDNVTRYVDSDRIGNWFASQGGGGLSPDPTAWWVNFGRYAKTNPYVSGNSLVGFQGIGTLGGGNLTVIAGRNAGATDGGNVNTSTGLDLAVASTGRVLPDGTLLQTGGGDLTLKVGGILNSRAPLNSTGMSSDYFGSVTDLRGNITVTAGAIGALAQNFAGASFTSVDPRALDAATIKRSINTPGPTFTPGDGTVSIVARGDLVFGGASDAGMAVPVDLNGIPYTRINGDGTTTLASGGVANFTLWTPATAISLYAAGGDVAPLAGTTSYGLQNANGFYPGTLIVAAANGDIRFAEAAPVLEMMPSPSGQLELLAAGSIYGTGQVVAMSGADMSTLATPFHPVFSPGVGKSNAALDAAYRSNPQNPIAFGEDTPVSNLHAGDTQPALIYAGIDIDDLGLGQTLNMQRSPDGSFVPTHNTWYLAAKPFQVIAGRDIVGTGATPDVFFNNPDPRFADSSDGSGYVSLIRAGRDIIYQSVTIAGSGLLDVQAGRNLYQGYYGMLKSVGPLLDTSASNRSGGAGIWAMAGVGPTGPDYAGFAKLYFDPANQLPSDGTPLAGSGKVVQTYEKKLLSFLKALDYTGTSADALAFFLGLPSEQQSILVRQVYFEELTAGGREETGAIASPRLGSYLRGRDAIAALFPTTDAQGKPITYSGSITMLSGIAPNGTGGTYLADAGIQTQFGGDIQVVNPGGQTIIGVEGVTPGAGAGLITLGKGDIDIYSLGSILLGQSRIMTTFGGNILAWSATGDINAGRGSKTTTIFTPPKRTYDLYGNIVLAPNVPSAGAGIATLNPIAGTPPGNIDLIAPLGTIDAGEAGIRVSGNINLAALQVLNAANIQVQGTSTGIPTVQGPPVGALTTASNATAATQQATVPTQSGGGQPSIVIVEVLGYGGGDPSEPPRNDDRRRNDGQQGFNEQHNLPDYSDRSAVQIAGYGQLSAAEMEMLTPDERKKLGGR